MQLLNHERTKLKNELYNKIAIDSVANYVPVFRIADA